jgi:hypothetical protein
MSAKIIITVTLAAFIVSVAALSVGGKEWLHSMEQADATVSYLDLARQATQKRAYAEADAYYKQALNFAATTENSVENESVALAGYSEFLRMKRNPLKDLKMAQKLDERALALRQKTN